MSTSQLVIGAVFVSSCLAASVARAADSPIPRAGTLTRESRTVTTRTGVKVAVEAGTFAVPENRDRPTNRVFELPYYGLRSTSDRPATPIFLLAGGPGASGIEGLESSVERTVLSGVEGLDHTWDDPGGRLATLGRIAAAAEASPAFRTRVPAVRFPAQVAQEPAVSFEAAAVAD